MDLNSAPVEILKEIHKTWLKQLGFKMNGRRTEKHSPPMHFAVSLSSQPTNTKDCVEFDIAILAAHDEYNPHKSLGLSPGINLQSDNILHWHLSDIEPHYRPYWTIDSEENISATRSSILTAFEEYGLPVIQRMSSIEGIISLYKERNLLMAFKPLSWALIKAGRVDEARKIVDDAIAAAPHENMRQATINWLEKTFPEDDP